MILLHCEVRRQCGGVQCKNELVKVALTWLPEGSSTRLFQNNKRYHYSIHIAPDVGATRKCLEQTREWDLSCSLVRWKARSQSSRLVWSLGKLCKKMSGSFASVLPQIMQVLPGIRIVSQKVFYSFKKQLISSIHTLLHLSGLSSFHPQAEKKKIQYRVAARETQA